MPESPASSPQAVRSAKSVRMTTTTPRIKAKAASAVRQAKARRTPAR